MSSQMKQALLQLATPPFDSGGVRDGLVHKSVSRAHSGAESELSTASTALTKQKSPGSRPHQGNNVSKPSQAARFCIDREFVQMEIRAAQEANKNIITVFESDDCRYDDLLDCLVAFVLGKFLLHNGNDTTPVCTFAQLQFADQLA